MRYDVFLSHDHGKFRINHCFIEKIADYLISRNLKVFLDTKELRDGDSLPEKIKDSMNRSNCILIFITKNYQEKVNTGNPNEYCYLELAYALESKPDNKIFPIVVEKEMDSPKEWGTFLGKLSPKIFINLIGIREISTSYRPVNILQFRNGCGKIFEAVQNTLESSSQKIIDEITVGLSEIAKEFLSSLDEVLQHNNNLYLNSIENMLFGSPVINDALAEKISAFLIRIKLPLETSEFAGWYSWIRGIFPHLNVTDNLQHINDLAISCLSEPLRIMDHVSVVLCEVYVVVEERQLNCVGDMHTFYTIARDCLFEKIETFSPQTILALLPDASGHSNYVKATTDLRNTDKFITGSLIHSYSKTSMFRTQASSVVSTIGTKLAQGIWGNHVRQLKSLIIPVEEKRIAEEKVATMRYHGSMAERIAKVYEAKLAIFVEYLQKSTFRLNEEYFSEVETWQQESRSLAERMKLEYEQQNLIPVFPQSLQIIYDYSRYLSENKNVLSDLLKSWRQLSTFADDSSTNSAITKVIDGFITILKGCTKFLSKNSNKAELDRLLLSILPKFFYKTDMESKVNEFIECNESVMEKYITQWTYLKDNIGTFRELRKKLAEQCNEWNRIIFHFQKFTEDYNSLKSFEELALLHPLDGRHLDSVCFRQQALKALRRRISRSISIHSSSGKALVRQLNSQFSIFYPHRKMYSFFQFFETCKFSTLTIGSFLWYSQKTRQEYYLKDFQQQYYRLTSQDYFPDFIVSDDYSKEWTTFTSVAKECVSYFRYLCEIRKNQLLFQEDQFQKNQTELLPLLHELSEKKTSITKSIYQIVTTNNSWKNYASSFIWNDPVYVDISFRKSVIGATNPVVENKFFAYLDLLQISTKEYILYTLTRRRDQLRHYFVQFLENLLQNLNQVLLPTTTPSNFTILQVKQLLAQSFATTEEEMVHLYRAVSDSFDQINFYFAVVKGNVNTQEELVKLYEQFMSNQSNQGNNP